VRQVLVLNGPNLSRLGSREPDVYGSQNFDDLVETCRASGRALGLDVEVRQTDDEGEMIRWVHEAIDAKWPVVLNISTPAAREEFRHISVVSAVADGTIAGFGYMSYQLALQAIAGMTAESAAAEASQQP
jgi:3-dehydroquinate dehydratase-2